MAGQVRRAQAAAFAAADMASSRSAQGERRSKPPPGVIQEWIISISDQSPLMREIGGLVRGGRGLPRARQGSSGTVRVSGPTPYARSSHGRIGCFDRAFYDAPPG